MGKVILSPFLNELETKKEEAFKEIQLMSSDVDVAQYLTKYSHFKDNRSRVTEILLNLRKHDPSLLRSILNWQLPSHWFGIQSFQKIGLTIM